MPASVLAAVLGAALPHAGWNAAIKADQNFSSSVVRSLMPFG